MPSLVSPGLVARKNIVPTWSLLQAWKVPDALQSTRRGKSILIDLKHFSYRGRKELHQIHSDRYPGMPLLVSMRDSPGLILKNLGPFLLMHAHKYKRGHPESGLVNDSYLVAGEEEIVDRFLRLNAMYSLEEHFV